MDDNVEQRCVQGCERWRVPSCQWFLTWSLKRKHCDFGVRYIQGETGSIRATRNFKHAQHVLEQEKPKLPDETVQVEGEDVAFRDRRGYAALRMVAGRPALVPRR